MISERGVVYRTKRMGPSTELMVYSVVSYDIREKRMGPSTEPRGTPYISCDGDKDELLTEVDWYLSESERYDWNHWSAVDWMPKTELGGRGEFGGQ